MSYAVKKKTNKVDQTYIEGDGLSNGRKPAHPTSNSLNDGLTKLELIAAMAMQGMLAGGLDKDYSMSTLSRRSAVYAGLLLKELEGSEE